MIESLIELVAVKSMACRSFNHPSFKAMVQRANPNFSVPVHDTLKRHIKHLVEVYRQLPVKRKAIAL
jgi:hypothetical protein